MRVPIIGLSQSGRTTLRKALSGEHTGHRENLSVVKMPDYRLEEIARIYNSKKVFYIEVELQDTIGDITKGGAIFSDLQGADALIVSIRGFDGGFGEPDVVGDAQKVADAIRIFDMSIIETKTNTLEREIQKGHSQEERRLLEMELSAVKKFSKILEDGKNIRDEELSDFERKISRNQGFLTAKPMLAVITSEEMVEKSMLDGVSKILGTKTIFVPSKLELELAELDEEEAKMFRDELKIPENTIDDALLSLKDAMGIIEFYTGNEKDAHAWAIRRGTTAIEAAGKIHSDIERGFIRAEIVGWKELVEAGGYNAAKAKSLIRIEGKNYVMQDGDYAYFRFNV
ncbi:DUF933 domain-containing protein [bacterium]|nr:DUF933 domain-containing protein [bacterium]